MSICVFLHNPSYEIGYNNMMNIAYMIEMFYPLAELCLYDTRSSELMPSILNNCVVGDFVFIMRDSWDLDNAVLDMSVIPFDFLPEKKVPRDIGAFTIMRKDGSHEICAYPFNDNASYNDQCVPTFYSDKHYGSYPTILFEGL